MNKCLLVFHYLTTIQLLEDSGFKTLKIRNLILNVHTFWIHDPLTIKTFPLICIIFNSVRLTTKIFLFLSILVKTPHFIVETIPTSLKMGSAHGIFITNNSWNLWLKSTKTFLGFLGGGTHSSSTSITIVASITSKSTSNISCEEDCNLQAWGRFLCSLVLLDSSTLQEIGLGGMRFFVGIWTPK